MTVLDYSATPGSNTSINGINVAEGCAPSGINNAIRQLMADIATGMTDGNLLGSGYLTKSGAYTVLNSDRGKTINCTAALTLTLTAAATVGAGWLFFVKANGGAVTIDPNASETIDGATTLVVGDGTSATIICDGTNFHTAVSGGLSVVQQVFTSSGTYTPTPGMVYCIIECVGGGGGGGGAHVASAGYGFGASGGGAGSYSRLLASDTDIGASKTVTIGAGGAGGSAGANNGSAGGSTSVGSLCVANGGGAGLRASISYIPTATTGGSAGTGDITLEGGEGSPGYYQVTVSGQILLQSGDGGASYFGGGAGGDTANTGVAHGRAANVPGAGGAGGNAQNGTASASGGGGAAGIAMITEFVA